MLSSEMFNASYYFNWQSEQNKKASQVVRLSSGHLGNSKVIHNLQRIAVLNVVLVKAISEQFIKINDRTATFFNNNFNFFLKPYPLKVVPFIYQRLCLGLYSGSHCNYFSLTSEF
jgi:hypothetical protein